MCVRECVCECAREREREGRESMNNTSHLLDTQTYLHLCVSLPVWFYLYFTPLLPGTSLLGSVFFLCVAPLSSLPSFSPPQSAFFCL